MAKSGAVKAGAKENAGHRKTGITKNKQVVTGKSVKENADRDITTKCGDRKITCKSLVIDGTKYRTRHNKKFENRKKWYNPDPNKIISVIPGTVLKLSAAEGKKVSAGDDMLVLEAMKMKNRILFPRDGVVKSVMVREGEKIPKGFLMIEMEN